MNKVIDVNGTKYYGEEISSLQDMIAVLERQKSANLAQIRRLEADNIQIDKDLSILRG